MVPTEEPQPEPWRDSDAEVLAVQFARALQVAHGSRLDRDHRSAPVAVTTKS